MQQFQFDGGTVWSLASVVSRVSTSAMSNMAGEATDDDGMIYAGSHRLIEAMAGFGANSAMHTAPMMRTQPWRPGELMVNMV